MKTRMVRIDRDSPSGRVYSYKFRRGQEPFHHRVTILIPSPGLGRFLEGAALRKGRI